MKAVILAAGRGTRLEGLGRSRPKGLLEFDGTTLLELSLTALGSAGIRETIIVVGHLKDKIVERIGYEYKGLPITYVENEEYASTGSMFSLSKLKKYLNDDILLLESDLLYEKRALLDLLEYPREDAILVSALLNSGDDVFVCADHESRLTMLGKNIDEKYIKSITGALVGISKLSQPFLELLFAQAEREYLEGQKNQHYEECILRTSLNSNTVFVVYDEGLRWIEIDNNKDLVRASNEIWPYVQEELND
jgi:choline kinase